MIAVSKKSTKRLIKGERYEVVHLRNSTTSRTRNRYIGGKQTQYVDPNGYLYIKDPNGINCICLSTSGFSDVDGKGLPQIDWGTQPTYGGAFERVEFSTLKKGDIIVCRSKRYKTLEQGVKYRISDIKSVIKNVKNYNGTTRSVTDNSIKFDGLNRWFSWNNWSFGKLSVSDSREIQLSSVFGDPIDLTIDTSVRRIDRIEGVDKDIALIKMLASAVTDRYRHKLGVVEWTCDKTGKDYKVTDADFKHLLKMPLKQILKIVETN